MEESKVETKLVGDGGDTFGTTGVRADDDAILPARNVSLDVGHHEGLGVNVVYGNVEKALDLVGVQIHSDDMVAAGDGEHVGDELGGNGRAALILFVHARIRIAWDDGGDAAGSSTLARGNEDEELHEVIVDVATSGLKYKDVLIAN